METESSWRWATIHSSLARRTGATWTTSTAGTFGNLARVRFLDGQFVAVGSSDKILFSTDGAAWTSSTLPATGYWDVALGNGVYVLAGNKTWVSSDGANWTQTHPMLTRPFGFPPYETPLDSVVFANGGFLGLPAGGPAPTTLTPRKAVYSTNGVDWIEGGVAPSSRDTGASELLFGGGIWFGTTESDATSSFVGVLASTNNGASWSQIFNGFSSYGGPMAFGQGNCVWVNNWPRVSTYSCATDLSWQHRYTESVVAAAKGAVFGNGTFVLVGFDASEASYILQSGNISGLPVIFQEPQDRGAVAMNPASFTVQAVGAATLTYQWFKNSNSIANATNATYSIASVETGDIGGYHAVIANSIGSVTSRVAQLTVAFLDINCYAGISVLGVPGRTYHIEASPATGTPSWQTVTNLVLPQTPYIWIDYLSPSLPARIYRASELP